MNKSCIKCKYFEIESTEAVCNKNNKVLSSVDICNDFIYDRLPFNPLTFGDIVIVEDNLIGVVVKVWINKENSSIMYEVYVRNHNGIKLYNADEVRRYLVRHKELDETELSYQDACEGL